MDLESLPSPNKVDLGDVEMQATTMDTSWLQTAGEALAAVVGCARADDEAQPPVAASRQSNPLFITSWSDRGAVPPPPPPPPPPANALALAETDTTSANKEMAI